MHVYICSVINTYLIICLIHKYLKKPPVADVFDLACLLRQTATCGMGRETTSEITSWVIEALWGILPTAHQRS
jgi:hypothetical protein